MRAGRFIPDAISRLLVAWALTAQHRVSPSFLCGNKSARQVTRTEIRSMVYESRHLTKGGTCKKRNSLSTHQSVNDTWVGPLPSRARYEYSGWNPKGVTDGYLRHLILTAQSATKVIYHGEIKIVTSEVTVWFSVQCTRLLGVSEKGTTKMKHHEPKRW